MNGPKVLGEQKKDVQPTEANKAIVRTLLTGFLVPIVCGLPELMVVKKQLKLRTQDGLLLARHKTSLNAFLSGAAMGWVSGGFKAISYANKEPICNGIGHIRGHSKENAYTHNEIDRILGALVIGSIDAVSTHYPSSLRALSWTNPKASAALNHMTFLAGLKKIYRIGFTTRILKASINAGCYVAITPWIEKDINAILPPSISKAVAILESGIFSGFMCTAMDVIGVHIYKEAVLTNKKVTAPSLLKMSQGLYRHNGLKIFISGAVWNVLVTTLAFATMTTVEQYVNSELFATTYRESYSFFKSSFNKEPGKPRQPDAPIKNQDGPARGD